MKIFVITYFFTGRPHLPLCHYVTQGDLQAMPDTDIDTDTDTDADDNRSIFL